MPMSRKKVATLSQYPAGPQSPDWLVKAWPCGSRASEPSSETCGICWVCPWLIWGSCEPGAGKGGEDPKDMSVNCTAPASLAGWVNYSGTRKLSQCAQ